jgi:hypothetical protein
MVYFPEQHVSIVVMINAFPNDGAEAITKGLSKVILKDLDAIGIFNFYGLLTFIEANKYYFIIAILTIFYWVIRIIRNKGNET